MLMLNWFPVENDNRSLQKYWIDFRKKNDDRALRNLQIATFWSGIANKLLVWEFLFYLDIDISDRIGD